MFKKLFPYEYVKDVFSIDFEKLHLLGFKGIIFDIDNTLVFQDEDATKEVEELFEALRSLGFKTVILSNNGEERVKRFLKNIDSPYICKAYKPFKSGYRKAISVMGLKADEVLFIGDQLFTDVFGANRSGVASVLVSFIKKDGVKPQFRRKLEECVLRKYRKSAELQNRLGGIEKS